MSVLNTVCTLEMNYKNKYSPSRRYTNKLTYYATYTFTYIHSYIHVPDHAYINTTCTNIHIFIGLSTNYHLELFLFFCLSIQAGDFSVIVVMIHYIVDT